MTSERLMHLYGYMVGSRIVFLRGGVANLLQDVKLAKPTVFLAVPRILTRIYDKVMQGLSTSRVKALLFKLAYNRKLALLNQGIITNDTIWDKLVFSKIQSLLGGNVKYVVSGSAPISENVLEFARIVFGCQVYEGYGQTECAGSITVTLPHELKGGHVGPPMAGLRIKLIDVPEMEYYAKDNRGEVCVKGPSVMKGYYNNPERTKKALDEDQWLHTGDIGQWMPNGTLKIIDRSKHIFKLAQGEYIAPEKVENIYLSCRFVAQIFVDGDSLQTFAVGVVVPDEEVLLPWAKGEGLGDNLETLCKSPVVKQMILDDLTAVGKEKGLHGFEQVKAIYLCVKPFSPDDGLLTSTLKSKRSALRKHFQTHIQAMYS